MTLEHLLDFPTGDCGRHNVQRHCGVPENTDHYARPHLPVRVQPIRGTVVNLRGDKHSSFVVVTKRLHAQPGQSCELGNCT